MQTAPNTTGLQYTEQASPVNRYSAKKMVKPVNFICLAPNASQVCLIGDFNDWDPGSHPMKRQPEALGLFRFPLTTGITITNFSWTENQPSIPQRTESPETCLAKKFRCAQSVERVRGNKWNCKSFILK